MESNQQIRYFSTFTGAGGFEIGIQKAIPKAKCVGMSEIQKQACDILRYKFKGVKNYGDITKINEEELPDFEILCGGFPCQSFSIAGKRMGFKDTRGTLFFDLSRIAKCKRPKILFFENVKGLLSHEEGRTITTILKTLDELGYDAEWQVLNSKYFGVPQNRERIIIIGHLREGTHGWIFPIREETKGAIRMVQKPDEKFQQTSMVYSRTGIAPTLTKSAAESIIIGEEDRTITINEAEVLQGFPKDWTKYGINDDGETYEISMRERFARMGNAVTTNVMEAVAARIYKSIMSTK